MERRRFTREFKLEAVRPKPASDELRIARAIARPAAGGAAGWWSHPRRDATYREFS